MEMSILMLVLVVVGYGVAFTRKGKVSTATIGDRRHELFVRADANTVFDAISAIGTPFSVDDKDREAKVIVVSSPVTFGTWGFFYPVFLQAQPDGTRIVIGCHSKVLQFGPLVGRAHKRCRDAIEAMLSIPEARVA